MIAYQNLGQCEYFYMNRELKIKLKRERRQTPFGLKLKNNFCLYGLAKEVGMAHPHPLTSCPFSHYPLSYCFSFFVHNNYKSKH